MNCKEKQRREEYYMTSLEEGIEEKDVVRVIDEIINKLDLKKLGYKEKERKNNAGCKRYPEKEMLKILVYGYKKGIHSGRKLEESCKYDKRFMWLIGGLTPDANTINDYRKDNIEMIEKAFYEINRIYIKLGILKIKEYSQDGFKIKAVNSKEKNYTKNKVMDRINREKKEISKQEKEIRTLKEEQEKVEKYLERLQIEEEKEQTIEKLERLKEEVKKVQEELEEYEKRKEKHENMLKEMNETGETQISLTDKESKLMKNNGKFEVSYNNQTAVDTKTHITIGIKTDNNPADVGSMSSLGEIIKREYKDEEVITNITDKGYQSKKDMVECLEKGIIPQVTPNDKRQEYVELETVYEENEVTEEERISKKEENIKKCLRAGIIPECYEGVITDIKVEEKIEVEVKYEEKEERKTLDETIEEAMRRQIFIRNEKEESVVCPMGEVLNPKSRKGNKIRYANKLACKNCKNPCTKSKFKVVELKEGQKEVYPRGSTLEKPRESVRKKIKIKTKVVKFKLKLDKEKLKKRMSVSEHSQGTMKKADNFSSFSMLGKQKASGEIALHFIASNIRRVSNMCGVKEIIEKIRELEKEDKKEAIREIKSQKLTSSRCVKLLKKIEKNFDFFYPQAIFGCIRGGYYDIINIVDSCKK